MGTQGNNVSSPFGHVRDSFISESEQKFFNKLLENPKERKLHANLLRKKAEALYKKATLLIEKVEAGEFNEQEMAKAEYVILHCLAAIEDLEKVLELELTL